MNQNRGRIIFSLLLILALVFLMLSREEKKESFLITGKTMGTNYNLKLVQAPTSSLQEEIDSVLSDFNASLSTYDPNSEISQINQGRKLDITSDYLKEMMTQSLAVWNETNGSFDPTVMPLVNFWGFGYKERSEIDTTKIDSIMNLIGFEKISFNSDSLAIKPGMELDFNAIAKGYGVDVISSFIRDRGYQDFMLEIGGEVYCSGLAPNGKGWLIGIEDPLAEQRKAAKVVALSDLAMATSGNYRNFYEIDGIKLSHTIDPATGYPEVSELLSVSVISESCSRSDALATAFMVMGKEKTLEFCNSKGIPAALIIGNDEGGFELIYSEAFEDL